MWICSQILEIAIKILQNNSKQLQLNTVSKYTNISWDRYILVDNKT